MNGRVLFLGLIMLALAGCSHLGGGKLGGATETGQASYYADKFEQRKTANGERYRHDALTAAHRTLPFGTRVQVTNLDNGRSVVVRINDRGPFVRGRVIDLSKSAFTRIGQVSSGLLPVKVVVLSLPPR
ncbi:rare lipoprotein A [Halopseudomonas aestusnigri]|uniref:Endolytic peptidoglycan transglycosylase RlpA n=2 Tax=Halopseudomonas aestusnigri TaxID=857252 RepID=A0AAQ1G4Y9_9GAMM|nr:rare lipoprotein A [Halopseudomonas aestusnigri]